MLGGGGAESQDGAEMEAVKREAEEVGTVGVTLGKHMVIPVCLLCLLISLNMFLYSSAKSSTFCSSFSACTRRVHVVKEVKSGFERSERFCLIV